MGTPKKKIAILAYDLSDNCMGRAFILAMALEDEYEVEIIGPAKKGSIWPPMANCKLKITHLPCLRVPTLFFQLSTILGAINADILYASKPRLTSFGFGLMKKWQSPNTPLILDIDDWEAGFHRNKGFWSRLVRMTHIGNPFSYFWTRVMHHLVGQADRLTTVSRFLQKKYGGTIIMHGKDTDFLNPKNFRADQVKKDLGLSGKRVVMFLGTPKRYKGIEELLQAVLAIADPSLVLALVGANPEKKLEQGLKEVGGERIVLFGKIPQDQVPRYMAAADIFAVPQRRTPATDGQIPSKLFDAMAMARPILSTSVSDIPHLLEGCGLVVQPDSPPELRKGIEWILTHQDQAREMGERARKKCIEQFSLEKQKKALLKVLNTIDGASIR